MEQVYGPLGRFGFIDVLTLRPVLDCSCARNRNTLRLDLYNQEDGLLGVTERAGCGNRSTQIFSQSQNQETITFVRSFFINLCVK